MATEQRLYTRVFHDVLESTAARCLAPAAVCCLTWFLRRWGQATRGGKREVPAIVFSWTGYPWPVTRKTFSGHRAELERKGFIVCANRGQALFRISEAWRDYAPAKAEASALEMHDAARATRVSQTKDSRASKVPTQTPKEGRSKLPTPQGVNSTHPQGVKMTPLERLKDLNYHHHHLGWREGGDLHPGSTPPASRRAWLRDGLPEGIRRVVVVGFHSMEGARA